MLNIAVFASGKGSNFRAIQSAILSGSIPKAKIDLVISNNSDAGALAAAHELAERLGSFLAQVSDGSEEVFIGTRDGMAIRFPESHSWTDGCRTRAVPIALPEPELLYIR